MDKDQILAKFSTEPDRYYKVELFEKEGFRRKSCVKCKRFFWTLDDGIILCPDHIENSYSFIGEPPTNKRFDYTQAWKEVESFFVQNNHKSVGRYPVVCRWRDDLYFTIASIVDFQRVMGSKVVFEFPANPLIVPQTCLRFKDIENVGVTGRHFSSFCMIGQHSIPNAQGYWKDKCVELDFKLLTERFGINKKEIVFVEDVWAGGGSFGSSLEYFVRGLELGNAVFTEFQGDLTNYSILDQKIIDMGAGLERFAWVTMGTPTAYDCCFGPITNYMTSKIGIDIDSSIISKYFMAVAKSLSESDDMGLVRKNAAKITGLDDSKLDKMISPLEGVYTVADHLRTLIFAISDGALPSNVGGGYNLRMILRRTLATIDRFGWNFDLNDLIDLHIDYLKSTYPELEHTRNDVKTIIEIEKNRYIESKVRMKNMASTLKTQNKKLSVDDLIRLYESDGITPDFLKESQIIPEIPSTFYERLADLHQSEKTEKKEEFNLDGIPDTDLLYYKNDPHEFEAKVLKIINNKFVVLDKTSFYARGGGQEPDHGKIAQFDVIDVSKHGNIVLHETSGGVPKEGAVIKCNIDSMRRYGITRNHTSTHVLNASARNTLGLWVWQHSAFKDEDYARLDITHHSNLTDEDITKIEDLANTTIRKDIPVLINQFERGQAEQEYGFRIYQGGVVPVKLVRIVNIEGFDVEACGGTHVQKTGELGLIKITKAERIQDGVVRLEFVSGQSALKYTQSQDRKITHLVKSLGSSKEKLLESFDRAMKDSEDAKKKSRQLIKRTSETSAKQAISQAKNIGKIKLYTIADEELDEEFHIPVGELATKMDQSLIYCALVIKNETIKIIAFCGTDAISTSKAGDLVKQVSKVLGGSGGGKDTFGQGGGKDLSKIKDALSTIENLVTGEK
ncbi:Alanine--tRNA ligase [Nitrosotalea sinensis]|uniref:Alanine--tRNA ligase n=1 Tax=Nitrosotalea sinensis TaxID=1499975 RepID=A0A2H1EEC5_9ARCH|nr:alanine--tRNA ligase [Candidatus Nitrosotalea sinensis]SHO42505.1 Alanine--tRNA ligase [Candidatus Nitrosotalea sinensis]